MALARDAHEDAVSLQIFATVDEAMLLTNDNTLLSWKGDLEARTSSTCGIVCWASSKRSQLDRKRDMWSICQPGFQS